MFYRRAIRPILFTQDPEFAHEKTLELLALASGVPNPLRRAAFTHPALSTEIAGIAFPNPVGLAAGCDKNGKAIPLWPLFGYGFVEIGTVTAQPQPGNPRPRVFRIPEHKALINRLGFNSEGSEMVAKRLAHVRRGRKLAAPLGVNIGKTKLVTGEQETLDDYRTSLRRLSFFADFIVINVSSPNTPGLRQWQEKSKLSALLGALSQEANDLALKRAGAVKPLFVKISPDLADDDIQDAVDCALEHNLSGIIATNTTLARTGPMANADSNGGLSGKPLTERSLEVTRLLSKLTEGKLPIISVGGIFTAEDAYERFKAGASLVQIYTAMVYEGPYLARDINRGLLKLMQRDGVKHISEIQNGGASTPKLLSS